MTNNLQIKSPNTDLVLVVGAIKNSEEYKEVPAYKGCAPLTALDIIGDDMFYPRSYEVGVFFPEELENEEELDLDEVRAPSLDCILQCFVDYGEVTGVSRDLLAAYKICIV